MLYHNASIRQFISYYVACASLVALTLWVIIDVIFIGMLGVCGAPKVDKPMLECHFLHRYHYSSRLAKQFDEEYSWKAFLGRGFAVYDEANHNMAHVCGKSFGGHEAKAAYCGERTAEGYALTLGALLFYIWGPLMIVWFILRRMFVKKRPAYHGGG